MDGQLLSKKTSHAEKDVHVVYCRYQLLDTLRNPRPAIDCQFSAAHVWGVLKIANSIDLYWPL